MTAPDSTTLVGMVAVIAATVGIALLVKWIITRKARRIEGHSAPDTAAVDADCRANSRVYYLYSQNCGACRPITPRIDALHEHYPNLIKLDVRTHPELARGFNVMATPSFVWVKDGQVSEVRLGAQKESWLVERLQQG